MKHKLYEIMLTYLCIAMLTGGCAAVNSPSAAPLIDGDVVNLFRGTARWLSTSDDIMIHTFYNAQTGVTVHARALADGFAIACEKSQYCDDLVGFLVNRNTYNSFRDWMLGSGGFIELVRNLPPLPGASMPTILVLPAIMLHPSFADSMMMTAGGMAVEDDAGNYIGSVFSLDESDGFADESDTWELVTP